MTSSHQSLVSGDVTRESPGEPIDDVIASDDDDSLLEKDIVKRRIDLFENQVSNTEYIKCILNTYFNYLYISQFYLSADTSEHTSP